SEGLPHRRIYLTGSPMWEVLRQNMEKIKQSDILHSLKLKAKGYFIVSVHREENVDNEENLKKILNILDELAEQYKIPIIVSTHPRTRKRIEELVTKDKRQDEIDANDQPPVTSRSSLISFLTPFGFTDYIHLQMNALCTISDSGTISEESAILSFPAISLRNSMERPEAQDAGTIVLTGFDKDVVLDAVKLSIEEHKSGGYKQLPFEYQIENTSWRVVKLILGNAGLSNDWWGIKQNVAEKT
ncbi:MAG TPA: UDP-N-acetylglucosamine 2-epimerase (non-hydrolyzing), partial [Calditrichaeota bacterium]|nr:UDP-N-acetylglucosamine 2-epimerase (non-hydrolyzing) [Calditrichota bacterium]